MIKYKKKGFVASTLVDFYAFILFILLIILFFFLFKLGAVELEAKIESTAGEADINTILLNYLRTTVEVDKENMNMAELISRNPKDYKSIQEKTEQIFKHFDDTKPFQILVNIANDECIFDCGNIEPAVCAAKYGLSNVLIPLLDGNSIEIGFCIWLDYTEGSMTKNYGCRQRSGC